VDKARTLVVLLSVAAVWFFLPSPAAAWFDETWLYSNLSWSPDGAKLFYEAEFTSEEGLCPDRLGAEIRSFELATGEVAGVVPAAIYIDPAVTPLPIKIEKLYGFELCSAEAGLSPEAYSADAIWRARDALYISEDFTTFIYQTGYSYEHDGYDVVREDVGTGSRQLLAAGAYSGAAYLKKSDSLVYTLGDKENSSGRWLPDTYLLDLRTGRKRRLGSFHWLGATEDERRATVWRYLGVRRDDNDRLVMSISLVADEAVPKELFTDRFYLYTLSRGGSKLAYARELGDPEGRLTLRIVDLITGESADLPKGRLENDQGDPPGQQWSPDDKYFLLQSFSGTWGWGRVYIVDTYARKLKESFESPWVNFFSWSPSGKYVAFETYEAPENLRVIDVEAGEESLVQKGEAAFFCWIGGSRFLYSSGGKLYVYDCEEKEGRVVYAWFAEGDYEVLTWINDSQLVFIEGYGYGNLHVLDARTGAHRILAPGNGCDFFFAEDGDLVFRTEGMAPGYPEYWKLDFATGYAAPCQGPAQGVSRGSSPARGGVVVPSPDGGRVAVLEGGKLELRDADGGNAVTLMEKGKGVNVGELADAVPGRPIWSPAGDKVAWVREGRSWGRFTDIWVANRDGGDVHLAVEADTNFNHSIYGERGE
jgi:Tol biopolymer transport system component